MLREITGATSGAALGYIHGGTRGAIKGGMAGYKLSKNTRKDMAPVKRKRTFTQSFVAPTRRRQAIKTAAVTGANRSSSGWGGSYRKVGSNASAVLTRKKKGVAFKKRKRVIVSKKFERKVKQALEKEDLQGKYLKVTYARMSPPGSQTTQSVIDFANVFAPIEYADAADILFNDRVPVENPTTATLNWDNYAVRKDTVINSSMQLEMKNMSQRTYTLKIYVAQPKQNPTDIAPNDAVADWASGLVVATGIGTNPLSNGHTTLYSAPTDCPQFNQFWKCQCETVVLQPGQSHTYKLQGPNDYVLDYNKLIMKNVVGGTTWMLPYAKFTRNVFIAGYCDLVTSTLAGSGRFPSGGAGVGGVVFEKRMFYKLKVPPSAGFQYPAGAFPPGTTQQLDQKLPTKVIQFFPLGAVGTAEDVLEENPLSSLNPID